MAIVSRTAFAYGEKKFTEWLYGDYNQEKLTQFELLYHVPIVKQFMDYKLDVRADEEYMNRYQLGYEDIHDPRKLKQTSSGSALIGSSLNFVSDNVKRLYG